MKHKINFCLAMTVLLVAGSLSCARASEWKTARVSPLHVSASGRYFETADGKPWFWLGDTSWSLLETYTPEEQKTYLDARAKMGFTVVQMVAAWGGGTGNEKGPIPDPNTAGVGPWKDGDPLKPNEAFWKSVDQVVHRAEEDGIYVGLLPAWGAYVVDYKDLTPENAEAYGRWLGQRYKNSPNIVWIVGGDRDVIWSAGAKPEFVRDANVWRAIGHGLQEGDGGVHPITFHPGGPMRNNQQEKWLAADMIQTWAWYKDIPKDLAIDYSLTPTKPVILAEGAYEDGPEYPTKPITPLIVRKQAYWTYLSGAFFTYGHNDMWRKNPTWKGSLFSGGAKNMRTLRALFASLPWWKLQPDQSFFASGAGSGTTYNAAAVATDGSWAMVYFSSPATAELALDRLKGKRFSAAWIDPATGHRLPKAACSGGAKERFTTPKDWPDAVLLIQKRR